MIPSMSLPGKIFKNQIVMKKIMNLLKRVKIQKIIENKLLKNYILKIDLYEMYVLLKIYLLLINIKLMNNYRKN